MKNINNDSLRLAIYLEIFSALKDIKNEQVICDRFFERIGHHFNIQKAGIYLRDLKKDELIFVSGIGVDLNSIEIKKISVYNGFIFELMSGKTQLRFDKIYKKDIIDFPFLENLSSALIFPIYSEKKPLGFAFFGKSIDEEIFSEEEENILSSLLSLISPILDLQMTYKELSVSQSKLVEAIENLKNFEKVKNSFLYNITHELKTPLVTIVGYSEMLHSKDMGDLNQIQLKGIETILKNSNHLLQMIEDLLTFVNLSDKISNLDLQKINIVKVIYDVVKKFENSNTQIILDIDYPEIIIFADPYLLSKAIEHLIDNAIKFNRENSPITVNVEVDKEKMKVKVLVIDKGIGMEYQTFIASTKNFIQESMDLNRKYGGIGFGLSFVNKIFSVHQFEVIFKSEKGRGTEIGFSTSILSFK
ncbi:MAG TPA: HAMP domain-containing sensor histidine kinase [Exilispira sp.]|nr:HAMP domain-containing sensor histidine kinase [Exilispira sp.]